MKLPVPSASANSLITTPLAQPPAAPVPGVALDAVEVVQLVLRLAARQGSLRCKVLPAVDQIAIGRDRGPGGDRVVERRIELREPPVSDVHARPPSPARAIGDPHRR